ncbi:hypothetical protein SAMN05421579_12453 [Xenorhabdus japonica]|uniref:Uncharacterized protein n=1 Tax=Xenorhabdus japonica TaxID=53341 RepID=A0A1I5C7H3_9GAMM|nr:hypothetical protein SAMN05421579_12453 [Xenorhabdus japonica]
MLIITLDLQMLKFTYSEGKYPLMFIDNYLTPYSKAIYK